jgi:SOS response regulatory protein OraA/RecX
LATILKTLAIYRLAFGQPRQVELIEHLLKKQFDPEEIEAIRKNLMIDLSPISYR